MARPLLKLGLILFWFLATTLVSPDYASAKSNRYYPVVHQVAKHQTLIGIAKRWQVPVDALCQANGIKRDKPIRIDQKLIIPSRDDLEGKSADKVRRRGFLKSKGKRAALLRELEQTAKKKAAAALDAGRAEKKARQAKLKLADKKAKLEAIAKKKAAKKKAAKKKAAKKKAAKKKADKRRRLAKKSRAKRPTAPFQRTPKRRNRVRIRGLMGTWSGTTIDSKGRVRPIAVKGFNRVLRSWRTGKGTQIHPRLIMLLTRISNHFGGRTIRIVSGYRPKGVSSHSLHNHGTAVDFKIDGVPNEIVRDYLRKLPRTGVGYYPNSTHVHLDTRSHRSYWVDYSGPGEKPRYAHQGYVDRYGPPKGSTRRGRRAAGPKSSGNSRP